MFHIRMLSLIMAISLATSARAAVIFVNHAATGGNSGVSWSDAFTDLQLALAAAQPGDEIWVAAGTYKPSPPNGARHISFEMRPSVAIYGGFAGQETSREQRNWQANITILSGDLNGDDGPPGTFLNISDNAANVVRATGNLGPAGSAIIDGFTISGGYAYIPETPWWIFNGGGMFVQAPATPRIENCTFIANRAWHDGGALMFARHPTDGSQTFGDLRVINCRFEKNSAGAKGGALATSQAGGPVVFDGCLFLDNRVESTTGEGGAASFSEGGQNWHFINCIFRGNHAPRTGGAVVVYTDAARLTNCLIIENSAGESGGALASVSGVLRVFNCTIVNNSAPPGQSGGVRLFGQLNHPSVIVNSIIRDNSGGNLVSSATTNHSATYSNVGGIGGGGVPGEGNIDTDPLFRYPALANFRLTAGSPCVDSGSNGAVTAGVDLDGGPRIVQVSARTARVDMGAYELRSASPGDVNGDGLVNVNDLLAVINVWGACPPWPLVCPGDVAPVPGDGTVNVNDLLLVINNWG